jgi:hypothetical protein
MGRVGVGAEITRPVDDRNLAFNAGGTVSTA